MDLLLTLIAEPDSFFACLVQLVPLCLALKGEFAVPQLIFAVFSAHVIFLNHPTQSQSLLAASSLQVRG